MMNKFTGIGNLGMAPAVQSLTVDGKLRSVVNVRIFFDRPVKQADDSYQDKGGFWLNVAFWGRLADEADRLLRKGTRVCVIGKLQETQWTDKGTGESRSECQMTADYFFIDTLCIESIQYQSKTTVAQAESA